MTEKGKRRGHTSNTQGKVINNNCSGCAGNLHTKNRGSDKVEKTLNVYVPFIESGFKFLFHFYAGSWGGGWTLKKPRHMTSPEPAFSPFERYHGAKTDCNRKHEGK